MPQHDYIISDQAGAAFLADLNNFLAAVVAQNSGASEPATMYAYMPWADTANNKLKIRNAANTAWVDVLTLSTGAVLGNAATATTATTASLPVNSKSANYTCVIGDANEGILHAYADNNARTFTIPANASVAYDVGTTITFINQRNTVTIAITSDTMTMAGTGLTGSRTLAANGMATALKVSSTGWVISGTGLS